MTTQSSTTSSMQPQNDKQTESTPLPSAQHHAPKDADGSSDEPGSQDAKKEPIDVSDGNGTKTDDDEVEVIENDEEVGK